MEVFNICVRVVVGCGSRMCPTSPKLQTSRPAWLGCRECGEQEEWLRALESLFSILLDSTMSDEEHEFIMIERPSFRGKIKTFPLRK